MKQKIVIKVSMPCEKTRSKAMALTARENGVRSVGIIGDGKDRLEVVGDGVDPVCLVSCLRRKLGHAELLQLQVVEVKDKKPEEEKKPEVKKPVVMPPLPQCWCCPGYYCRHHCPPPPPPPPPPLIVCDEPSICSVM